jgi:hypothetical protein
MTEQRQFGESDHEPLGEDDILAQAISRLPEQAPSRDLWAGIAARIDSTQSPAATTDAAAPKVSTPRITFTLPQLAMAASLLIAVASGLTWMVAHPPAAATASEPVIQAYGVTADDDNGGQIQQANFADAQYNAAVTDLEHILRDERDRLDPRTVQIIERNLKAIDDAITEARTALDNDPANPYLNSHLADARRRKLDLLRHATSLASTGGD